MKIRARFQFTEETRYAHSPNARTVNLEARYEDSKDRYPEDEAEIRSFSEATPSGRVTMFVTNPDIPADFFEVGADYYVYIDKVHK